MSALWWLSRGEGSCLGQELPRIRTGLISLWLWFHLRLSVASCGCHFLDLPSNKLFPSSWPRVLCRSHCSNIQHSVILNLIILQYHHVQQSWEDASLLWFTLWEMRHGEMIARISKGIWVQKSMSQEPQWLAKVPQQVWARAVIEPRSSARSPSAGLALNSLLVLGDQTSAHSQKAPVLGRCISLWANWG